MCSLSSFLLITSFNYISRDKCIFSLFFFSFIYIVSELYTLLSTFLLLQVFLKFRVIIFNKQRERAALIVTTLNISVVFSNIKVCLKKQKLLASM